MYAEIYSIGVLYPEDMQKLGKCLGALLGSGDVVVLTGPLGAGKTTLAQGIAAGLEINEQVTSPTFTIIRGYRGRLPFHHVDAYRLEHPGAAEEIGLEEYLGGPGVTVIEWAMNIEQYLPSEYLQVDIAVNHERQARIVSFRPVGQSMTLVTEELKVLCEC